jgi:hypothetical protein
VILSEAAAWLREFWLVVVGFTVGGGLLAWTARPGNDERARRERVWTLEASPRGLARLVGWVLTIDAVWRVVGYLADRRPVEFLVAAAVLLLAAKGIGRLKQMTAP